jgi:hypothetical protein
MMLGRVDEVDGNYVATRLLAGVVPLGCVYVASKAPAGDAVPIRTSWRSLAVAYGRAWAPVAAVAVIVAGAARGAPPLATILPALLLVAVTALAHRSGRLSDGEKDRLRLLGTVTGLRIRPEMLQPATREAKLASLRGLMAKAGIPASVDGLLAVIDDVPVPALPLVYGYARYAGDDPGWRRCAEVVFRRHEASAI